MRGLAEQILDENLKGYPWVHWSKENAINAMISFEEACHKERSVGVEIGFPTQEEIDRENDIVSV